MTDATLDNDFDASSPVSKVVFTTPPANGNTITVSYDAFVKAVRGEIVGKLVNTEVVRAVTDESVGSGDSTKKEFALAESPVITRRATFKVTVTENGAETEDKTAVLQNDFSTTPTTSKVVFARPPANAPRSRSAISPARSCDWLPSRSSRRRRDQGRFRPYSPRPPTMWSTTSGSTHPSCRSRLWQPENM